MSRPITYREFWQIICVLACIVAGTMGCVSYREPTTYAWPCGTIIVAESSDINAMARDFGLTTDTRAFFVASLGLIVVPYATLGQQPDLFALGHEVWHQPELGGNFHK